MTKYQLGVIAFVAAFAYSALLWNLDLYNLSVLLMLMSLALSVTILWEICRPKLRREAIEKRWRDAVKKAADRQGKS